ncbi:MAG: glycosyl transferase [Thiotrichales bacterium]|nr:MAG: glycosyl transferase [Thiotrichales bacterium]
MKIIFFLSVFLCCFSYFLYPLILKGMSVRRAIAPTAPTKNLPGITLIITAHNEEARISSKLLNTHEIDYPMELLEVIVASDCSSDRTDEIVATHAQQGVRLVRADKRKGKEYAQLCAIREAKGDILVFSDVATQIEPAALKALVCYFDDPLIGAVSSEDRFISQDGSVAGEGVYVKYEMWLRGLESQRAGLVGLSGSFFAARRVVCEEWDIASPSDFNTALNCARHGLVAISAPDVVGIYSDVKDPSLEYRRKLRTIIRGITAISRHPEVLNPFKMGMFSFQVWSHKILRWTVPWFMLLLLMTSVILSGQHWFFCLALLAQLGFYALVAVGYLSSNLRSRTVIKIPYFFAQVNLAIAAATIMFLRGKRMTTWSPSKR